MKKEKTDWERILLRLHVWRALLHLGRVAPENIEKDAEGEFFAGDADKEPPRSAFDDLRRDDLLNAPNVSIKTVSQVEAWLGRRLPERVKPVRDKTLRNAIRFLEERGYKVTKE